MDWLHHTRPSCPSPSPRVCPSSCPLNWWCHPTISSSATSFFSCPQSFPASGSFPVSQLFSSDGHSIGASASASVLSMNIQDWFPLGWTGWISLLSKGLSRVFFSTTILKHQFFFFIVLLSYPYMTIRKTKALTIQTFVDKVMPLFFNNCLGLSYLSFQRGSVSFNFTASVTSRNDFGAHYHVPNWTIHQKPSSIWSNMNSVSVKETKSSN